MRYLNLTVGITLASLLTTTAVQAIPKEQQVEAVVSHLVGVMDTSAQAAANPKAPSVRMTTCKVQINQPANSVYLYQEQALTKNLDNPYRQRFLEIKANADSDTVESQSFKPENGKALIGLCSKPENERKLNLSNIGTPVCSVLLKPFQEGYIGETPSQGCPANIRGAVRITNTILLHSRGMDTWDRGFDAQGNQVWGAANESYQYRWLNR